MAEDTNNNHGNEAGKCPFRGTRIGGAIGTPPQIDDWWPNRLQVELLHQELFYWSTHAPVGQREEAIR